MSTFRNPVGPQPSRVYWRRRLVLLIGLVAVIVVVALIIGRPGAGTPKPTPSGSHTPSSSSTPTPASTGAAGKACDPAKVTVTATLDSNSFAAGVNPNLTFALKNTGSAPCLFSAGSDVQEFRITSGDELIWSSKDCQTGAVAASVTLQPFVPFAGSKLSWDRTRSSTDTCSSTRDQVIAGGASYHLQVIVNGVKSDDPQFILE